MTRSTGEAVEAFRLMERASLNLDKTEFALERILARGDVDMEEYVRRTEAIRAEYEQLRERLAIRHKLPGSGRHAPE